MLLDALHCEWTDKRGDPRKNHSNIVHLLLIHLISSWLSQPREATSILTEVGEAKYTSTSIDKLPSAIIMRMILSLGTSIHTSYLVTIDN